MDDLQTYFNTLEENLLDFVENYHEQKSSIELIKKENELLKSKVEELSKKIHILEQENKNIKVVNAMSGNEEYKKLMKIQLNKMIKEIDYCIVHLKK